MIPPWWERYPGLYQWEVATLKDAGFTVIEEHPPGGRGDVVKLRITDGPGMDLGDLLVTFPDLYPWFRFEVQTTTGTWLGRHHHPFGATLCLIGRGTENWSSSDSVADFLSERLPAVIATAAEPASDSAAATEERAGEPFSDYYSYQPGSVFLVDGECSTGDADGGTLALLIEGTVAEGAVRGVLVDVRESNGTVIGSADHRLASRPGLPITGRWVRLASAPVMDDAAEVFRLAAECDPSLDRPHWQSLNGLNVDVLGVVFPEETRWRTNSDGWIFVVRSKGVRRGA